MKLNNTKKQAGLTLIEITLVIAVLLGLISVLFIGVSAYKEGSNRAKCILNISSFQKAVRSYQNLYGEDSQDDGSGGTTVFTQADIVGTGKLLSTFPVCPSQDIDAASGGGYADVNYSDFPAIGTVALICNEATDLQHEPANNDGW